MEKEMEITDLSALVEAGDDKGATQIYEVGYHLIPSVSDDDAETEVAPLMKALKSASADVIGERAPLRMPLAYGIDKKVDGVLRTYDEALFGWVAFECAPAMISDIDQAFKKHPSVLRHLVVKTNRDTVSAVLADPSLDAAMVKEPVSGASEDDSEAVVESVGADPEEVTA